jgi:hypothetical protein
VIVDQYKGRGRQACATAKPGQRHGFVYRLFMRCFLGSHRMRL